MTEEQTDPNQKHGWIYLFNLGFYILPMVLFPYSWEQIAVLSVALVAFVALYLYCFQLPPQRMWLPIIGMFVIACLVTPLNSGSIALFSYVGFFVGFAYRWRIALFAVIGVIATMAMFHFWWGVGWDLFIHYGSVIVITVAIFGRVERLRQRYAREKQRSEDEIERLAKNVERERIARDLHDILGHTLSSIILKSDLAKAQLSKQQYAEAEQQLAELSDIARQSLSQVRQSVSGYQHGGLVLELKRLEHRLHDAGFQTAISGLPPQIEKTRETALVLALTELVTNIIRHSKGQNCEIHFDETSDTYMVRVVDNGECEGVKEGNGLSGVSKRLKELGGSVDIANNRGCAVTLMLPKQAREAV
ncbi:sensor histidine kinase [Lysobacter sp. N42]|nr:sensor histidine kinase [Aliidiomarina sp. B3213]TCZ91030.1 sensor histidine kinase [Lysobacter sp. N42]